MVVCCRIQYIFHKVPFQGILRLTLRMTYSDSRSRCIQPALRNGVVCFSNACCSKQFANLAHEPMEPTSLAGTDTLWTCNKSSNVTNINTQSTPHTNLQNRFTGGRKKSCRRLTQKFRLSICSATFFCCNRQNILSCSSGLFFAVAILVFIFFVADTSRIFLFIAVYKHRLCCIFMQPISNRLFKQPFCLIYNEYLQIYCLQYLSIYGIL